MIMINQSCIRLMCLIYGPISSLFLFRCFNWPYPTCLTNQPTNQPTNQSINQSSNQSIIIMINQSISQVINQSCFMKNWNLILFLRHFWKKIHMYSETTSTIDLKICSQQGIHVLKVYKKTWCRYLSKLFLEKRNGNA